MKKFVVVMIVLFVMLISVNLCSADDYYDNNPNYMFITTYQGKFYLDLSSIDVQEYNPPHYQIAGTFIHVSDISTNNSVSEFQDVRRYNWYTKESFSRNETGVWIKNEFRRDPVDGFMYRADYRSRLFANALFKAAYNMNFYND